MSRPPSTVSNNDGSTFGSEERQRAAEAGRRVTALWDRNGDADLPAALNHAPELLADRSVFFDLAQREYRLHRSEWDERSPSEYCDRFPTIDEGLRRSLRRLIEVEQCLGNVSVDELLDLPRESDWPRSGEAFSKFQVLRELGRGSAGRVYLCRQAALDRLVVVKVSPAIRCEASKIGPLRHANVVPVHDSDVEAAWGLGWISMPYLGEKTLRDATVEAFVKGHPATDLLGKPITAGRSLRRRELYEATALELFAGLADGLRYVHGRGILHGDLKPSNVLVTDEGIPMIIDFNLAQDERDSRGHVGGTLAYMAPEQLTAVANRQHVPRHSISTDVFAFGMLMHEALIGEPTAESSESGSDLTHHALSVLRRRAAWHRANKPTLSKVDPPIAKLVSRCLAESPAERPHDFESIRASLDSLCSRRHRQWRFLVRRPKACLAALASAMLFGFGLALTAPEAQSRWTRWVASQHLEAGRYADSITMLERHLENDPDDFDAHRLLANGLLDSDAPSQARDHFMRVYRGRMRPLDLALVGYCYNLTGQPRLAISAYSKSRELGLVSPAVEHNQAVSLMTSLEETFDRDISGDIQTLLEQAYKLSPENESIRLSMLRHHRICVERSEKSPTYPVEIASFPRHDPCFKFCFEAARFVADRSSDERVMKEYGLPALQRVVALRGLAAAKSSIGSNVLSNYESTLGITIQPRPRVASPAKPPMFIDPR